MSLTQEVLNLLLESGRWVSFGAKSMCYTMNLVGEGAGNYGYLEGNADHAIQDGRGCWAP